MKKLILTVCALFLAGNLRAEEKPWKNWFETALKSLKSKAVSRFESKSVRVTAVAAVRGAEMDLDPMQPYWKGGITEKAAETLAAEKKEFAEAVELVLAGKQEDGEKALSQFETSHPNSALLPDVKEALSQLRGKETAAPAVDKKARPPKQEKTGDSGKKIREEEGGQD